MQKFYIKLFCVITIKTSSWDLIIILSNFLINYCIQYTSTAVSLWVKLITCYRCHFYFKSLLNRPKNLMQHFWKAINLTNIQILGTLLYLLPVVFLRWSGPFWLSLSGELQTVVLRLLRVCIPCFFCFNIFIGLYKSRQYTHHTHIKNKKQKKQYSLTDNTLFKFY